VVTLASGEGNVSFETRVAPIFSYLAKISGTDPWRRRRPPTSLSNCVSQQARWWFVSETLTSSQGSANPSLSDMFEFMLMSFGGKIEKPVRLKIGVQIMFFC
jgi:hypothetical protein